MHLSPKRNILQFPRCPFLYPLPPRPLLISLCLCLCVPLYLTLKPYRRLSRLAQDKFCLQWDDGGGRRPRTKGAFIAAGSGWLRRDNGHILQLLKQIAVCSLSARVDVGELGFCGQAWAAAGKRPGSHVDEAKIKQQRQR